MKSLKSKININSLIHSILNYGSKVSVILLVCSMFAGFLNPARISENTDRSISLVKSAFYFRDYVEPVMNLKSSASSSKNKLLDDSTSYEDMLAAFMNMEDDFGSDAEEVEETEEVADSDDYGYADFLALSAGDDFGGEALEIDDDDSSLEKKAARIKVLKFKNEWKNFAEKNPEVAGVFKFARLASILSFVFIILTVLGLFISSGSKLLKKIGLIVLCVGAVLTAASMINFNIAYYNLLECNNLSGLVPRAPSEILFFVIVSLLSFIFALCLLVTDRTEVKNDSVKSVLSAKPFQYTYRVLAIFLFILLFIPGANPARISDNINRNVSLFTSGFVYNVYVKNLQRVIIRGMLPEYVMRLSSISSMICCLGILSCSAGSCMSVGNNKLKRIAHYLILGGSAVSFVSIFGILRAYAILKSSPHADQILPIPASSAPLFMILLCFICVCALVSYLLTPAPLKDDKYEIEAPYQLFLMILPFLILVFIFSYLPLWGWRYAFFDYKPGDTLSMDAWVGFKWFKAPFDNPATRSDILRVLRNTLAMSGLGIAFSWMPMIFAIFLSEIKNTATRKIVQTLTTVPNFISWVLVYAIAFCIFGTEGFISSIMVNNGFWDKGRNMLMGDKFIWLKMWLWGTWKGLGWSAIMYIAAISGIDQQLYEAATVDGAGRFQKIFHITIPELLPTYLVLLILSVSGILSNGMDQYLCFKNPTNKNPIEVLDLYVYQLTFGSTTNSNIPFSTVVSMFKSLVSVILLFITNKISKWIRGTSIF